MFYEPEPIRLACANGNLNDLSYAKIAVAILLPDDVERKRHGDTLYAMLRHMPDPAKQARIIRTFNEYASKRGCAITDMRWWDIVPVQRNLVAVIHRDGISIHAQFFWRSPRDHSIPIHGSPPPAWIRFPNGGPISPYLLDFEAGRYDQMLTSFDHWLTTPLILPPTKSSARAMHRVKREDGVMPGASTILVES
jgi:hypothetical protein